MRAAGHPAVGLLAAAALVHAALAGAAEPAGTPRSREALALCNQARDAPASDRPALLGRSLGLADTAVADDERDALAHFARFCALGERARLAGASVTSLLVLRHIRQAVDRALEIAPDFSAALLGKGALLVHLPRLLGGDRAEGERLVRRALAVDPDYAEARLLLAEILAGSGRTTEATREARRALATAERQGSAADADAARRLLASLGA